jgi:glutamyl-tRNA synthetase
MKLANNHRLAELVCAHMTLYKVTVINSPRLEAQIELYKGRVSTLIELTDELSTYYIEPDPAQELIEVHLTSDVIPALQEFVDGLNELIWEASAVAALIKVILAKHNFKMPKLAMPLRVILMGKVHTPSVDAVIALLDKNTVIERLKRYV